MERGSRGAAAVAGGYLVAFFVTGSDASSWFVAAIAVAGGLAATAGLRAVPRPIRLVLGASSTVVLAVLGVLGIPVSVGLLLGALLIGGGTMSLVEARQDLPA